MQRPVGVTIIAILEFLGAALAVCVGLAFTVGAGLLGRFLTQAFDLNQGVVAVLQGLGILLAIFAFAMATLVGFVAYGMLNLKNWARIVTIVLSALSVLSGLGMTLFALAHFNIIIMCLSLVRLAISGWILWYLLQPQVQLAFNSPASATATA